MLWGRISAATNKAVHGTVQPGIRLVRNPPPAAAKLLGGLRLGVGRKEAKEGNVEGSDQAARQGKLDGGAKAPPHGQKGRWA